MTHFARLRDLSLGESTADDIRGINLYDANDDKLGKIDDVIVDRDDMTISYVVVDAGNWLTSKQVIVPVERLTPSAHHTGDFQVSLTKEQIKCFPKFEDKVLESPQGWSEFERNMDSCLDQAPLEFAVDFPMDAADEASKRQFLRKTIGPSLGARWVAFENRIKQEVSRIKQRAA